jgi:hypothetical protein
MKPKSKVYHMGIILLPYTRGSIAKMEKTWLEGDEQRLFCSVGAIESKSKIYQNTTGKASDSGIERWKQPQDRGGYQGVSPW